MKSPLAYLAIILLWAALYLPGLGSREIRGEEWRRTLPARTMLNTGEWLVPFSGGRPYLRKPPLILWVSAASFKLTGVQNEWTARLPSTLLMLGASLGICAFVKRVTGSDAAFIGSVFFLTSIGCIEKGRIAEIEVYYIAFTALAFAAWLAGFMGKLNRWAAWLTAGCCLGLAFLAKGPMHLLFFYLIAIGACWKTRRWSELRSLPHLAGLALCLAMILAWAIPFMQAYGRLIQEQPWLVQESGRSAFATWQNEIASRVSGEEETSTKDWLVRGPRALVMFLPWVLLVPLFWKRHVFKNAFSEADAGPVIHGVCWGILAGFAFMILLPSSSPRYVAPLLGPVAVVLGWLALRCFSGQAALLRRWSVRVAGIIALGVAATMGYLGRMKKRPISDTAHAITQAMQPKDAPLVVFHLGQVPYPFYLPPETIELYEIEQLPDSGVRWMLTTPKMQEQFKPWFERRYGTMTKAGEFTGPWGDAQQDKNRKLVLLRFAGL